MENLIVLIKKISSTGTASSSTSIRSCVILRARLKELTLLLLTLTLVVIVLILVGLYLTLVLKLALDTSWLIVVWFLVMLVEANSVSKVRVRCVANSSPQILMVDSSLVVGHNLAQVLGIWPIEVWMVFCQCVQPTAKKIFSE